MPSIAEKTLDLKPDYAPVADSVASLRPGYAGIFFGVGAAISYTLANSCLRGVSTQLDFVLCASVKATCTATLVWPWVIAVALRGGKVVPPLKQFLWLLFAAVQVQLLGGIMLQIALGVIGIALVVPIYLGAMVFGTAILGRFFLHEPVDRRTTISLFMLVSAVAVLSLGAKQAHDQLATEVNEIVGGLSFVWGVLAAMVVGAAYAVLAVVIRGVFKTCDVARQTPIVIVATVGMLMLGSWSLARGGFEELSNASTTSLAMLIGGGTFNALGFFCLTGAIKLLPVVYVNAINISQAALAAVIGVLVFSERPSVFLFAGLAVMLLGFGLLSYAKLSKRGFRKRATDVNQ